MAMVHLQRVIIVLQEYKIKRCLKLLFLRLRRQAICIILGDLCKQEAAFIAGLDFTKGQPERYKNVLCPRARAINNL